MATDYEKKYKEILEWARKNKARLNGLPIEEVLPELAESEDERIRKYLIWVVNNVLDNITGLKLSEEQTRELINNFSGIKVSDILAWLEKQKETTEKEYVFRPLAGTDITIAAEQAIRRANEGDRLVLAFNGAYIPVRKGCNANKIVDIYESFIEKQKEQKPLPPFDELTPEEKMNHPLYLEGFDTGREVQRVFDEQKPAEWSEEDEAMLKSILDVLLNGRFGTSAKYRKEIDWLKSFRPHWKPSEEQMKAFKKYIEEFQARAEAAVGGWNNFDVMIRLYEQLKKL